MEGAAIERGRVISVDSARTHARVESITRAGVIAPSLAIPNPIDTNLRAGEYVYFFMFSDGGGRILGRVEAD